MADPDVDVSYEVAPESSPVPRWGLGDALAGWLLGLAGGFLTLSLAFGLSGVEEVEDLSLGWFAVGQTGLWGALLAVSLVASYGKGNGMVADYGFSIKPMDAVVGGACGLAAQFLIPLLYLPLRLPGVRDLIDVDLDDMEEPARELADKAQGGWTVVLLAVTVGLIAPVVEEIFYRGLVQRSMQRRLGPWIGLALTSLAFGLVHLQPINIPALTFAGFVFGYLAYRSGRLGPAIAAHVVFNMVTVVLLVSEG